MKFSKPLTLFLIATLFLTFGCIDKNPRHKRSTNSSTLELSEIEKPIKKWLDPNSLIVRTPGQGDVLLPEVITSPISKKTEYLGMEKTIPGVTMLKQTVDERIKGESARKSKYPVIINFKGVGKERVVSIIDNKPEVVRVLPKLQLDYKEYASYKKISLNKNLYQIHNEDTLYPPVSIPLASPIKLKAYPFYYKENAFFDISVIETYQDLPNPFIREIAMDTNGIMWFETHTGGLIAYDGQFFEQFDDKRRLAKHPGLSMLIDSKGNIWTGTQHGGVYCFDGINNTLYTTEQGLVSNSIMDILEDRNGNIWFATTQGIVKYDGDSFTTYNESNGLSANYVFTIYEDKYGNIWSGTFGGGVSKFNGQEFTTYNVDDGLCFNYMLSITQDHNGNYWFGSNGGGVSKFDGKTFTNYTDEQGLESNVIIAITEDNNNNLWFGTHGNGVTYFDGEAFINYSTNEGLSADNIRTITEDDKGNLWIGTDGSGITKINLNGFNHYVKTLGLRDNNITAIYQDNKDRLCFAPFDAGIVIFDKLEEPGKLKKSLHINSSDGLSNNVVLSITQDYKNNYWFGTYDGGASTLAAANLINGELMFTNYSDSSGLNSNKVRMVIHDNEDNVWFATEGGATKFDGHSFTTITKENGLGDDLVTCIYQDSKSRIWFGTMDGGVSYLYNDTLVRFTKESGIGSNSVWIVTEDNNGIIWFGTANGIVGYNGETFRNLNTDNGLVNNKVFSLVVDNNNDLWVGTIKGLSQVNLNNNTFFEKNGTKPVISNYGRMDGLNGMDFTTNSVLLDNMNCIWWGTDKTLTMLDLSMHRSSYTPPAPHINAIAINSVHLDYSHLYNHGENNTKFGVQFTGLTPFLYIPIGLSLPYDMNYISFNYSATDWSSPNQMQYQYMIEGFDSDWTLPTKENIADYRNIPPGDYIFKLKARGRSDNWSDSLEYPFKIRRPWYLAWWSILIDIFLLGFLIWGLVKWRVSIVQRQKVMLAGMVVERTKDLDKALVLAEDAAKAKSQFIATISHELRTPLNAIMGLTHIAINNTIDSNQEDYLKKIDRSAMTLLSLINEILDFSKIEAGKMTLENVDFELELVINSIIELNSQSAKNKNLELVINVDPNIPEHLIGDPLRIGQIITNLCNNAIKFTNEGEVIINIDLEEEISKDEIFLQVSVKDTGIGISEDQKQNLFDKFKQADTSTTRKYGGTGLGLSICKLLIEMMDGQIWLDSKVDEGTTFSFDFKVGIQKDKLNKLRVLPEELQQYSILVCDDNLESLNSITSILKTYSLNIETATSGEEVMEMISTKQYDLLIIDLQLKGISGLDTILSIRANEDISPIKTILLTDSMTGKESFERNIVGIDGYILKPAISSVLIDKVLSVFGMESKSSESSKSGIDSLKSIRNALSGSRVLLAEDNELNQQVIIGLLKRVGIKPELAENGAIALQKAITNRYDLILMDLHMPIMDGFNASIQIREKGIETPVVAITADAMESVKNRCIEVGINDIITKPIKPSLLYDRVFYWISGKNNIDSIAEPEIAGLDLTNISLDELDIVSGIKRFGGDKHLYFKMLKKFLSTIDETINRLNEAISSQENKKAHLIAHSLKGESGNLGAKTVSNHASILEECIKNRNCSSLLEVEIKGLQLSVEELTRMLENYNIDNNIKKANIESRSLNEIVVEMVESLKLKNPNVFDLLDELEETGVNSSDFNLIKQAIRDDHIDSAINLLKNLT